MFECYVCKHLSVYWMSDEDAEAIGYSPGIVSFYTCGLCGAEIEVYTPVKEDKSEAQD